MTPEQVAEYRQIFATGKRAEVISLGNKLLAELSGPRVEMPTVLASLNGEFSAAWEDFMADRKERKKPVTSRAAKSILKKLAEHPDRAAYALRQCIERRWSSFEWEYFDRRNGNSPVAGKKEGIGERFGVGS